MEVGNDREEMEGIVSKRSVRSALHEIWLPQALLDGYMPVEGYDGQETEKLYYTLMYDNKYIVSVSECVGFNVPLDT